MGTNLYQKIGLGLLAAGMMAGQASADRTWTGSNNTNWTKKQNWNNNTQPISSETAIFATLTTNKPVMDADAAVAGVQFTAGGWTLTSSGGRLSIGAGGIDSTTGNNSVSAPIVMTASSGWDVAGGTLTVSGTVSGAFALTKTGAGTLVFSGSNSYSGGTTVNAGTLELNGVNRLSTTGGITLNGGTLDLKGYSQTTSGNIVIDGGTVVNGTLTKTGGTIAARSGTISAILNGNTAFEKTTEGVLTLTGTHSYTGATTVTAGTLLVNGSIASSSGVTVAAGATLGGSGFVTSLSGEGTVGPGNSPGILTSTSVNGADGLDFNFQFTLEATAGTSVPDFMNPTASGNDVLRLTSATPFASALTAANVITVDFSGVTLHMGDKFLGGFYADSADFSSSIGDAQFNYIGLDDDLLVSVSTVQWTADFGGGDVPGYITEFTVVPEPGTLGLLGFAGVGMMSLRRRHRKTPRLG